MAKKTENPGSFQDHPRKQIIRQKWAKVLLALIQQRLQSKLVYLGLPGIKALDILAWIDHLDKVIAFQCNEYEGRADETSKSDIEHLTGVLNTLEASEKIKSYQLYQGYIEDVIITGIDENGAFYSQGDFITVYNLDFCNTLTSPRKVVDNKGNISNYFKLDVIKKLLDIQEKLQQVNGNKFIMFLTVNSNFLEDNMDSIANAEIKKYKKIIAKITKPAVREVRLLKAYTFHHVTEHFKAHNFDVEFLPPIFYEGSSYPNKNKGGKKDPHMMLTFTILGTKMKAGASATPQNIQSFLESKFIFANDTAFSNYNDPAIASEKDCVTDVDQLLKSSNTYTQLWA